MRIGHALRIGGALALLFAGLVHLDLYFGGYRSAGSVPAFGRSILLAAIAFGIVAVAVAARREWLVRLAGIAVPLATLGAFAYTHTGHTLFGFQSDGLEPSPQAALALITAIAAIVLLAATFIPTIGAQDESSGIAVLAGAGAGAVALFVGLGIYWADKYDTPTVVSAPTGVAIADFTFTPQTLTVPEGTTVTWSNNDPLDHSVLASDQSFSSGGLAAGATFEFTFESAGEFTYVCGIHPEMSGAVTVTR